MKMKVMTIIGTRPEIIKLCRVVAELDKQTEHVFVHTGQNYDYELNEIFFKQLEVRKPDYFLNAVGDTLAQTIGNIISKTDEVLEKEKPDAILLLGDTNSGLGVIAAKRRKIPIFHMEAGNRCFDQRVPEEINRKIIDHISDINMPYTEHARRYLLAEGIKPETIIKTGSPTKEVLDYYMPKIDASKVLHDLELKDNKYFVVSIHREENVDSEINFKNLLESLNKVAEKYSMPLIVSTHPRTKKRLDEMGYADCNPLIIFSKPLGLFDYVKLQKKAFCVVSDSGTITEESSILGFPGVTIRQAHERPEGMDEGTIVMSGLNSGKVLQSIDMVTSQHSSNERRFKLIQDYDVNNVSTKIVRIIMSYVAYVNRTVWCQ